VSLRDVDDRWLPVAAARVRAWAERLDGLRTRGTTAVASFDLRQLDERYAKGPLRALHQHPVVGLVLATALVAAGLGAALDRERAEAPAPRPAGRTDTGPSYDALRGSTLGPAVGTDVAAYVRTTTQGLVTAVRSAPGDRRVALVSFSTYLTPEGTQVLLNGFPPARVFLRAPSAGAEATPLPVEVRGDLLTALRKAYADTARSRAAAATSYQGYVDTLKGTTPEDERFRELYAAFARAARIEAREYGGDCACVYAALVVATPGQLLTLRQRAGVRAVELAPAGYTTGQVQVQPLLPEVSGTVPRPSVGGQS
jgi:hypothetical protein